jgi:hypothetical protein
VDQASASALQFIGPCDLPKGDGALSLLSSFAFRNPFFSPSTCSRIRSFLRIPALSIFNNASICSLASWSIQMLEVKKGINL